MEGRTDPGKEIERGPEMMKINESFHATRWPVIPRNGHAGPSSIIGTIKEPSFTPAKARRNPFDMGLCWHMYKRVRPIEPAKGGSNEN
jgi:hypothetical protein